MNTSQTKSWKVLKGRYLSAVSVHILLFVGACSLAVASLGSAGLVLIGRFDGPMLVGR